MIDLHTHTNESDGTLTPAELVNEAIAVGLEALAISDHDTFAGYDRALPLAREQGLDLVCGIELSTKLRGRTVHLLGYFLQDGPSEEFRAWLDVMQASRRERNLRMIERLQSLGIDITSEEVEAKGRTLAGRPHFARLLLEKGYVASIQQAFEEFLDESAKGYVDRREPQLSEGIERILAGRGIPSVAHPIRIAKKNHETMEDLIAEMRDMGLRAIEAYHSDHGLRDIEQYLEIARRFSLAVTGGSDFHGQVKPRIRLGRGYNGNLDIPLTVLEHLRNI